jgi:purine-binding chemotaxis protein CheW
MATTYLTFQLASEIYAVPLASVSEIATYPERISRVPTAPAWLRGLFSLRGSIVPALDLCRKLGFTSSQPSERTCILVTQVEVEGLTFIAGMIVDRVNDLMELEPAQIESPPAFGSQLRVECLLGIVRRGDNIVCVLDLPRLFRQEELLTAALVEERERTHTAQLEEQRRQLERASLRPQPLAEPMSRELGREDPDMPGLFMFEDS